MRTPPSLPKSQETSSPGAIGSGITPGADHAVYALEPFGAMVFAGGGFTALNSIQSASFLAALGCP